jgi:hypothetical protein
MTNRTASMAAITGLDRQAGANASAHAHSHGQSVRVAHAWIDILHTRAQRRAERHNNHPHRAAGFLSRTHPGDGQPR